ncbi:MAG TPA: glutamate-5-semialdehyde dehydrogenase [Atribacter sp.]|jgi:glutamate-5-semialdehyde dehydrogenase|uniref:glutamate-5-semialdehyde dehydrogenase n=1 Tax=Atribacter sp. TaxID=2847780 RepID=UPI002B824824|nr:glutamate-5-semialdehyde dehydrogenase [Atribacter sp.]MDD3713729.1 glutamate-5-semialdehyde dehydrogenase [Atribacterota bacterium]MDI9595591.1 glutamate-5-semialdehyde dehydrogenase [Atribacterota bacterium]HOT04679.1 glutamate-5-semialdehyde dehydrogenase [Atribacter sp.]HQK82368.1 glutamate-5-semialdehyde dehydrogenase [Atribacter sp.]
MAEDMKVQVQKAKKAAQLLATVSTQKKNDFLGDLAQRLEGEQSRIEQENQKDVKIAVENNMKSGFIDRLILNKKRIQGMADGLRQVAALADPVGEVMSGWKRPNGLMVTKVRVPLGVLAIIYEARPNVTIDSIGLGIKSGNSLVLRGSSSTLNSNRLLILLARESLRQYSLPEDSVQLIESTSHDDIAQLLALREYIDVAIPRGGTGLIHNVVTHSQVPVIETGVGNCHVYVDKEADLGMAERIVMNAKIQRPSVCNAVETLLIHQDIAKIFLPQVSMSLKKAGVEIRGCEQARQILPDLIPATEDDWKTEYLDLILAVKVVKTLNEAIEHINTYGTRHSESIITENYSNAKNFMEKVDSAAVYVNASTRFTDGEQFGLGAEIGISTQKIHARGPMGLQELTTIKYVVYGTGQIRNA